MENGATFKGKKVSIPLEQGNVFRQAVDVARMVAFGESQSLWNRAMSFDYVRFICGRHDTGLNPFGTGQCLSTKMDSLLSKGFRSQSLWNRAMSFDKYKNSTLWSECLCLNPFGTGQCLSTE